jgi:hypothetical protein
MTYLAKNSTIEKEKEKQEKVMREDDASFKRQPNEVREVWKPLCDIQVPYCRLYFGNDD